MCLLIYGQRKIMSMKTFLYICAHPDDDSQVGGTMKKLADEGVSVNEIVCTSGKRVVSDSREISQDEIKNNRIKEVSLYCKLLGAKPPFVLDQEERVFSEDAKSILAVVKSMRDIKPDVVVLMNKADYHFEHTISHKVGYLAYELACRKTQPELGEPLKSGVILQSDGLNVLANPLITFNTSETHEAKIQAALEAYKNRLDMHIINFTNGQAIMRGERVGYKYGECFELLNPTWYKFNSDSAKILAEFVALGS